MSEPRADTAGGGVSAAPPTGPPPGHLSARDAAAALGVGLVRLEQRRHRMAELFLTPAGGRP